MNNNIDPTEEYRRAEQALLNARAAERAALEETYGQVWTTEELRATDWEVLGFMDPYVVVKNRKTGNKGSLQFQQSPRYFFNYQEDE